VKPLESFHFLGGEPKKSKEACVFRFSDYNMGIVTIIGFNAYLTTS
jgi:hypothetical protein